MGLLTRRESRLLSPASALPGSDAESVARSARASLVTGVLGVVVAAGLAAAVVTLVRNNAEMDPFDNLLSGCALYAATPLAIILPLAAIVSGVHGLQGQRHWPAIAGIVLGGLQTAGLGFAAWLLLRGTS